MLDCPMHGASALGGGLKEEINTEATCAIQRAITTRIIIIPQLFPP
jgi:hypothetical protein